MAAELSELEAESDYILVDAGSGLGAGVLMLAAAVEQAVVVSTPEPTSIADAHAAIGRFGRLTCPPRIRLLVNQAASTSEAADMLDRLVASSRQFRGRSCHRWEPVRSGQTPTCPWRSDPVHRL